MRASLRRSAATVELVLRTPPISTGRSRSTRLFLSDQQKNNQFYGPSENDEKLLGPGNLRFLQNGEICGPSEKQQVDEIQPLSGPPIRYMSTEKHEKTARTKSSDFSDK